MQQFYRLDLRRLGAGRAWRLISQLPAEARVVSGHVVEGWSLDRELLALILETVDAHRLQWLRGRLLDAKQKGDAARLPQPLRFPRPHDPPPQRRQATHDELIAFARR